MLHGSGHCNCELIIREWTEHRNERRVIAYLGTSLRPFSSSVHTATVCYPGFLSVRRTPVEAERRQVTVLFADMVGFTSFSERSGEEAAYTLMRSLSKLMDEAVREQLLVTIKPIVTQGQARLYRSTAPDRR
jgi:hypothetical protein